MQRRQRHHAAQHEGVREADGDDGPLPDGVLGGRGVEGGVGGGRVLVEELHVFDGEDGGPAAGAGVGVGEARGREAVV